MALGERDEEPGSYRCPPAWLRWAGFGGAAVVAWTAYLAGTSDRPFDVVLAAFLVGAAVAATVGALWRLGSRSTSVSVRGLTIRRGRSSVFVPWAQVAALRVDQEMAEVRGRFGGRDGLVRTDRALCCERDGTWHVLPYLTTGAGRRVEAEVARLRVIWQRERGRPWKRPSVPPLPPDAPGRWGRALLVLTAGEFVLVCTAVLLLDRAGGAEPLTPATGAGVIVFLTLVLAVPTAMLVFLGRRRRR